MAIIQNPYGGGVLIGSIGSTTFQRGRFGNLARSRTKPVNPNTLRQQTVKAFFTQASAEWDTLLTQIERDGWVDYALNTPVTGPKGNSITLTGRQMWMRARVFQLLYGGGPGTFPPTVPGIPPEPIPVLAYDTATGDITLTSLTGVPAVGIINFLISRNLAPSRNYWKGPFTQSAFEPVGVITPAVIATVPVPGVAGDKVFVQSKVWDANNNTVSYKVIQPVIGT